MTPPDLLDWPEVKAARDGLAAAEAARLKAADRIRRAPHGEIQHRQRALQEATHAALRAAMELDAVERGDRR